MAHIAGSWCWCFVGSLRSSLKKIIIIFNIYFWLCSVFVAERVFSVVAESGDYSPAAVHWPLVVVTTLVEHGL